MHGILSRSCTIQCFFILQLLLQNNNRVAILSPQAWRVFTLHVQRYLFPSLLSPVHSRNLEFPLKFFCGHMYIIFRLRLRLGAPMPDAMFVWYRWITLCPNKFNPKLRSIRRIIKTLSLSRLCYSARLIRNWFIQTFWCSVLSVRIKCELCIVLPRQNRTETNHNFLTISQEGKILRPPGTDQYHFCSLLCVRIAYPSQ